MATAHIESKLEDIAEVVLMPGDPLRAKYIAENFLEDYKLINKVRNMFGYTGYYKGNKVTVFSSGMGIPSMGIYCYELFKFYNVKKIIRIGTCGTVSPDVKLMDVILSKGAFSKTYFAKLFDGSDIDYIESSDLLNQIILDVSKISNISIHYGNTITSDVFDPYCDDHDLFMSNFHGMEYLASEMEAFALFYIAKKLNRDATALMTVVDSKFDKRSLTSEEREQSLNDMITLALESIIK